MKGRRKLLAWLLAAALASLLGLLSWLAWQIWSAARRDESRRADVIVVFGAAEYRGRPSPVLRARLDHALELYRRGMAPRILTTGGPGGDPNFTEGGVGRNYLVTHGVPSEDILTEDESTSTTETVLAVAEMMDRSDLHTCVVVSDGYHLFRIKRQFHEKGIEAYGSPRGERYGMSIARQLWVTLREAMGYALWEIGIRL